MTILQLLKKRFGDDLGIGTEILGTSWILATKVEELPTAFINARIKLAEAPVCRDKAVDNDAIGLFGEEL